MATGGIFTIITNDGKQDRMLMATALLHDRLASIHEAKKLANRNLGLAADDVENLPTLLDIEKTHVLFTNAHFKPFASIGFEYNKVRPSSGNSSALGNTIQFSIPQFGDFFHDIAFHCTLSQPTITSTASTVQDGPAVRWADYFGERMLKKVQQEVNGNPLDEYTLHATVCHREYRVAPNKLLSWQRCVGQEVPEEGFVRQANWSFSGQDNQSSRVHAKVSVGAQTPSGTKSGSLEVFIPLLFWYNKDVRLAVPSVAIPFGQRFINIELASQEELVNLVPRGAGTWASPNGSLSAVTLSNVELYINNIFMNPEVHKIYIKRVGFSLIRVHRQQLMTLNSNESSGILLQQLKWPIEYLFVGVKVNDYFTSSTAATLRQTLDTWDKFSSYSSQTYTTTGQEVDKVSLAGDGTSIIIVKTDGTVTGGGKAGAAIPAGSRIRVGGLDLTNTALIAADANLSTMVLQPISTTTNVTGVPYLITKQGLEIQTKRWVPTVDTLGIQAHSIDIYKAYPSLFFNAYTTYHYGGPNINAPKDVGALFVPFCLYPGTYQPSGHINLSRAREFHLSYTSSVINGSTAGLLVVIASAINFLLITDGSAVLRYST